MIPGCHPKAWNLPRIASETQSRDLVQSCVASLSDVQGYTNGQPNKTAGSVALLKGPCHVHGASWQGRVLYHTLRRITRCSVFFVIYYRLMIFVQKNYNPLRYASIVMICQETTEQDSQLNNRRLYPGSPGPSCSAARIHAVGLKLVFSLTYYFSPVPVLPLSTLRVQANPSLGSFARPG